MKYAIKEDTAVSAMPHQAVMDACKARLAGINDVIPVGRPVVYIDYPLHFNIGDILIWMGTKEFFRAHGHNVVGMFSMYDFCHVFNKGRPVCFFKKNVALLDKLMATDAILVIHGGGNLGDLYIDHMALFELLAERYKRNRIVILPQTIYFMDKKNMERTAHSLSHHPDLHIFTRDSQSLPFTALAKAKGQVMPDMAHQLWKVKEYCADTKNLMQEKASLHLLRKDFESLQQAASVNPEFDWKHLTSRTDMFLMRCIRKWQTINPFSNIPSHYFWHLLSSHMVRKARNIFLKHDTVVTDRLHGMILGALLERNIIASDNNYGKVSAYYHEWLAASDKIVFNAMRAV